MNLKKFFVILILTVLCFSVSACSNNKIEDNVNGRFVKIEEGNIIESIVYQQIMYDPDTMVMYSFMFLNDGAAVTVIYNADGTPKLYKPDSQIE